MGPGDHLIYLARPGRKEKKKSKIRVGMGKEGMRAPNLIRLRTKKNQ